MQRITARAIRLGACTAVVSIIMTGCEGGSSDGSGGGMPSNDINITVDGNTADWVAVKPVYRDAIGDATSSLPGSDVADVCIGRNGENLYIRLDLANGPPASNMRYVVLLGSPQEGVLDRWVIQIDTGRLRCTAEYQRHGAGPIYNRTGLVAVNGNTIEASVPFDQILLGSSATLCFRAQTVTSEEMDIFDTLEADDGGPNILISL